MDTHGGGGRRATWWAIALVVAVLLAIAVPLSRSFVRPKRLGFSPSKIAGVVKGVTSDGVIPGATVGVYSKGTLVASGVTDSNGGFAIPVAKGDGYEVRFSANGYIGMAYHGASAVSGRVTHLEAARTRSRAFRAASTPRRSRAPATSRRI
ncbi:MAG: hypothetical protein WC971_09410 [Coriobacteriia bacterium]